MGLLTNRKADHFVSATTKDQTCRLCSLPATHKLEEIIPPDDPSRENTVTFPNTITRPALVAYVCCYHFVQVFGREASCR